VKKDTRRKSVEKRKKKGWGSTRSWVGGQLSTPLPSGGDEQTPSRKAVGKKRKKPVKKGGYGWDKTSCHERRIDTESRVHRERVQGPARGPGSIGGKKTSV